MLAQGPQLLLVQGGDGRAFTRSLVEDPDNTLLLQEVQLSKGGKNRPCNNTTVHTPARCMHACPACNAPPCAIPVWSHWA